MSIRTLITVAGFIGTSTLALVAGGTMLVGFMIALIVVVSGIMTLLRLPRFVRAFLLRHPLISNVSATSLAALLINPATVTGLACLGITWLLVDLLQSVVGSIAKPRPVRQLHYV